MAGCSEDQSGINISKDTSTLQSRGALGHVLAYHAVLVPRLCLQPRVGVSLGLVFRCLLTCVNLRLAPLPMTSQGPHGPGAQQFCA